MIVKIDHLAWCPVNIAQAQEALLVKGYERCFHIKGVPNPQIKKGLMGQWSSQHDLMLFEHKEQMPIEILDHGHCLKPVGRSMFMLQEDGGRQVMALSNVLEQSVEFWKYFGFKISGLDAGRTLLTFNPLLGGALTLIVQEEKGMRGPFLDTEGFNSLAFISSNISNDLRGIQDKGVETTAIDTIILEEKTLEIFFAKGPSGEMVEVIGLKS